MKRRITSKKLLFEVVWPNIRLFLVLNSNIFACILKYICWWVGNRRAIILRNHSTIRDWRYITHCTRVISDLALIICGLIQNGKTLFLYCSQIWDVVCGSKESRIYNVQNTKVNKSGLYQYKLFSGTNALWWDAKYIPLKKFYFRSETHKKDFDIIWP